MDEMEKRLLMNTMKSKDELLINQINDYRIKKEEIEELDNKNNEENINNKTVNNNLYLTQEQKLRDLNKNMQWLTSLRDYDNNNLSNIIIKKQPTQLKKRCNSSSILNLKNRYISFHSFDKRDIIFNLSNKFDSIYAQITPSNNKESEKIRDTFKDLDIFSRNSRRNKEKYKLENNILYKTNMFDGLNIQGKKLINFEIELSKELEGKKKRIVKIPYLENEIKSKIFVETNKINKIDIPQTVKNTVELHYN